VIIPHFEKYPLKTKKYADFMLFKAAVLLVKEKQIYTEESLQKIVNIRSSMNKGLTDILTSNFLNTVPATKLLTRVPDSLDPKWLLGFIEGEGCFFISLTKAGKNMEIDSYVSLLFKITQHNRDIELIKLIVKFFNCGFIVKETNAANFHCKNTKDILEKIIPFFEKNPLLGNKRLDYADFYKVALMLKNKSHLTLQGLTQIKELKVRMNKGRKNSYSFNKIQKREFHISTRHENLFMSVAKPICITPIKQWGSIVKILLKMDNSQVTKAFNWLVGTSETIRLLSIISFKGRRFYRTKVNHPVNPAGPNKK
jgi:hypothetical protein